MENISAFFDGIDKTNFLHSLIVIVISYFLYRIITSVFVKSTKSDAIKDKLNNKSKTYIKMISSILRYIFFIITVLIILQINGVNVSSMLAGVGIVSVIIGLAIQDALKDIIRGFNILSDNYFSVGDVVIYNDITAKVLAIGLKTTKLQELVTSDTISIANRNIEQIKVVSEYLFVRVPMPYEIPIDKAEKVISDIMPQIHNIEDVSDVKYIGVTELADSSIQYLLKIICPPERKLQVKRDALGCVLRVLAKNNIAVPYNQLDIHQK